MLEATVNAILEVLDSQRPVYAAEDAQVESRGALSVDLIALYQALGGGWERRGPVSSGSQGKGD